MCSKKMNCCIMSGFSTNLGGNAEASLSSFIKDEGLFYFVLKGGNDYV
jgi:hypothetical protein